jgi:transcriptional regulator with XRE-family HTH domain
MQGLALAFLRRLKGRTQEQLAATAGISLAGLKALEQGRRQLPRRRTLDRITSALGVDQAAVAELVDLLREQNRRSRSATVGAEGGLPSPDSSVAAGSLTFRRSVIATLLTAAGAGGSDTTIRPSEDHGQATNVGGGEELGLAVVLFRWLGGWKQSALASATGISTVALQAIEEGRRRRPLPAPLLATLGVDAGTLRRAVVLVRKLRRQIGAEAPAEDPPRGAVASPSILPDLRCELPGFLRAEVQASVFGFAPLGREEARLQLRALWPVLNAFQQTTLKGLVRRVPGLHRLEACELFCQESLRAAGDRAQRARQLAELAVQVAERVRGSDSLRSRLWGFAGAHLANGLRVGGQSLPAAAKAMERALEAWQAGAGADGGLLNAARVLSLVASLRRDQRRLGEAVAALDEGLRIDRWGETPALLLGKARTFIELGEFEASIDQLCLAGAAVEGHGEARTGYVIEGLWITNLCRLGRFGAAEKRLPRLRSLTCGNRLDLLRADWQMATVAAGLGRGDEAVALLRRVRTEFVALRNAYDAAMVTLELAEVQAVRGRVAEVQALARESAPIFMDQRVHREAQRALTLFRQAAEEERVSLGLLRSLLGYLRRARHDPQLRFTAGT